MSSTELAARMGVTQSSVIDLERNEVQGGIKLDTLRRAAAALDSELFYVLVPRTSLEESVRTQARRKAARHLEPVAHHSRLEDQALEADAAASELDDFAERFIDHRGLWSNSDA